MLEEKGYGSDEFTIDDAVIEEAERDKAERATETTVVVDIEGEPLSPAEFTENEASGNESEATEEKPKPKRGRKKKVETPVIDEAAIDGEASGNENEATEEKPKPKRGRKKKAEAPVIDETTTDSEASGDVGEATEEKPKAKRGRKKKVETPVIDEAATDGEASGDVGEATEEKPKAKRGRKKKVEAPVIDETTTDSEASGDDSEGEVTTYTPDNDGADDIVPDDVIEIDIVDIMPELFPLVNDLENENAVSDDTTIFEDDKTSADDAPEEKDDTEEESAPEVAPSVPETPRRIGIRKEAKYDADNPRRVDFIFDFIELFVFTLVAVLVITTFFIRHSIVDGPSMEGTLQSGDTLLLSNVFYTPKQGDIVVVDDHTSALPYPIVKRVIAVGGQWIRIARDGVYVSDEPFNAADIANKKLDEPYVYTDGMNFVYTNYLPGAILLENPTFRIYRSGVNNDVIEYYELQVPEGEIFIMGDHRNASTDSRIIGTVRVDAVLGKVLFRILPFSSFGSVE